MIVVSPALIATEERAETVVCVETFAAVSQRIQRMLAYGRPIAIVERLTYLNQTPKLVAGLRVEPNSTKVYNSVGRACLEFVLGHNILVFGTQDLSRHTVVSVTTYDNVSAATLLNRYLDHEAVHVDWLRRRREMVHIKFTGGQQGQAGPGVDDEIVISDWNGDGACTETIIGFDSQPYAARKRREAQLATAAAEAVAKRPTVNVGDLVVVPKGVDSTRSIGYRILVEDIGGYGVNGPRIKANGDPMMSRSVLNADPRGYYTTPVTWEELAKCRIVAGGGNATIKPAVK